MIKSVEKIDKRKKVKLSSFEERILDAIAKKMGEDSIFPVPSRAALISKAIKLYIEECRKRPEFKELIEGIEANTKLLPFSTTK